MKKKLIQKKAQTAIEYMLLLGVIVAIVLIGFKTYLPRTQDAANIYFNRVSVGILGEPNPCGDGLCCAPFETPEKCPVDCPGPGGCP